VTPRQALETATVSVAELLGMADALGALRAGYLADIAAVEGGPLADVDAVIGKVRRVMKGGEVVVEKTR
jgi:imidazolonepropionase-like amidohydrolase